MRSVSTLLSLAHQGLAEAGETRSPSSRYALAHL
ncbi:MAG: hypothetical protein JWO22_2938, partial [Frankiales bacterium]|nr:hypothetical protein [Frankiales bacterium]